MPERGHLLPARYRLLCRRGSWRTWPQIGLTLVDARNFLRWRRSICNLQAMDVDNQSAQIFGSELAPGWHGRTSDSVP